MMIMMDYDDDDDDDDDDDNDDDDGDDNECHCALPPASQKSKTGKDFTETFWTKIPRCQFFQMFSLPSQKSKGNILKGNILKGNWPKVKILNKSADIFSKIAVLHDFLLWGISVGENFWPSLSL